MPKTRHTRSVNPEVAMFQRRGLLLTLLALPVPLAAAMAEDPWWDPDARRREWEREREIQRRRAEERHERWDEARAREEWERARRAEARREWERVHGPYRP
jgi:hypothetical protein